MLVSYISVPAYTNKLDAGDLGLASVVYYTRVPIEKLDTFFMRQNL